MNYFNKYLKYKKKYLKLKNDLIGGDRPNIYNIRNINLFDKNSREYEYLNPLFGFMIADSSFIRNYMNFGHDKTVKKFISHLYHSIDTINYQPINALLNADKSILIDLGKFLNLKFKKTNNNDINNKIKKINKIKKNIKILQKDKLKKRDKQKKEKIKKNYKNHLYFNDQLWEIFNEDNIELYKNELNKKLDFLQEKKIKEKIIYNNPKLIDKYFNKKWPLERNDDIIFYHIILSIVWWLSDNKTRIKKYYEGLGKSIPSEFENNNELDSDKFIENIIIYYMKNIKSIHLISYEYSLNPISNVSFPDCGETTLRNFFQIILFDPIKNKFDLSRLDSFNIKNKIKEYFTLFPYQDQLSTDLKDFNGYKLNARDSSALLLSNLNNVNYKHNKNKIQFEIKSGFCKDKKSQNMLEIINNLSNDEINDWNYFNNDKLNIKLIKNLNEKVYGVIDIATEYSNFQMIFNDGHFRIEENKKENKQENIDLSGFNEFEKKYLYLYIFNNNSIISFLLGNEINGNILQENEKILDNLLYYYNLTENNILKILYNIEKIKIPKYYYNNIYNYLFNNYSNFNTLLINYKYLDDIKLLEKIIKYNKFSYIILNKKNEIIKFKTNFSKYNYLFESELFKKKFNKLEYLELYNTTPKKILDLNIFDHLKKLKTLKFRYFEITKINLNLNLNLKQLEILELKNFNQPLEKSLDKLINLKSLTLDYFNQPLENSLDELINLESLTLKNFNQNLESSLDKLINLESLNLIHYNQNLGFSLNELIYLENLTLIHYNQDLGFSLYNLENLKSLTLDSFDQKINEYVFYNLINLQKLTLKQFNQRLDCSLYNLNNLQHLILCNYNYKLNDSLLFLVTLKTLELGNYNDILSYSDDYGNITSSFNKLENLQELIVPKLNINILFKIETLKKLTISINNINSFYNKKKLYKFVEILTLVVNVDDLDDLIQNSKDFILLFPKLKKLIIKPDDESKHSFIDFSFIQFAKNLIELEVNYFNSTFIDNIYFKKLTKLEKITIKNCINFDLRTLIHNNKAEINYIV